MRKYLFCCAIVLTFISSSAQPTQKEKVKVFLDCTQSWLCDFDYVRSQMKMVDFVRDRFSADVHVLVNTQSSSSGGTRATVNFIGQGQFQKLNDTLTYFNDPTTTQDEQRKKLVQYLSLGLVPFVSKTIAADKLQVTFTDTSGPDSTTKTKDPWNYWVFQFSANGSVNGSQNYKSGYFNAGVSADKETEDWKINLSGSINRDVQTIIDQNNNVNKFTRKEYYGNAQVAKSINSHWSYGISASYNNSLFSNLRGSYSLKPKLEYSLFPYSAFNTQRVIVQYMIGGVYNHYYDTTIYFKTTESQVQQNLNLIASFTKPWGSINVGVFYSNYFDDFVKNNLSFNGAISWRIVKGLNFAVWGNYGLIHDQINFRKGNISRDDLLVRNKELLSSYQYSMGIGFSYRFGSVLNSIVNPRFKGLSYSINF